MQFKSNLWRKTSNCARFFDITLCIGLVVSLPKWHFTSLQNYQTPMFGWKTLIATISCHTWYWFKEDMTIDSNNKFVYRRTVHGIHNFIFLSVLWYIRDSTIISLSHPLHTKSFESVSLLQQKSLETLRIFALTTRRFRITFVEHFYGTLLHWVLSFGTVKTILSYCLLFSICFHLC